MNEPREERRKGRRRESDRLEAFELENLRQYRARIDAEWVRVERANPGWTAAILKAGKR